jgi:type IX secretion system PorP/SprF family membrane protein
MTTHKRTPLMKKVKLALIFLLIVKLATAQDAQFSQYYQAPMYLNPGFTGITPGHRLVVNHRLQWPNLPQAFSTYAASYDVFLEKIHSGVGILFTNNKIGSAGWRSINASLLYSYKIRLTEEIVFSPGLSFGYGTNGLDRSKLMMGDALEYGGNSLDPKLNDIRDQQYMDFGSGFVLYAKRLWVGASFAHLNRPNLSVLGETSRLGVKTSIHGGIRLDVSSNLRAGRPIYFTPSFIYRMQGSAFSQLELGANFHIDPISVGLSYRGKPFSKTVSQSVEQDAVILFMGLYLKNLTLGYSYDFTVSQLRTTTGGSHEASLIYEFKRKKSKTQKNKLIPCPAFYSKEKFWD